MLHLAHKMRGTAVRARDGEIGTLDDFLFEQSRWTVRYLVVNTGSWLSGRQKLLSPMAVAGAWDRTGISLTVRKEQIEASPELHPASLVRADESSLLQHYGQPFYWEGHRVWGLFETPAELRVADPEPLSPEGRIATSAETERLRGTEDIKGFHIHASDGPIGHVDDFFVGEESWRIRYLLVDTSNWIGGRSVLVATDIVETIDRDAGRLRVADSRDDVRASPTYESIVATLDPAETGPPFLFI